MRFWLGLVLAGCGAEPSLGEQLFSDPALSSSQFNAVACATCHETGDPAGLTRPPYIGYPLGSVLGRERYWGGQEETLLGAVNACFTNFMRGREMTGQERESKALFEYMQSLGETPSQGLPLSVVETVVDLPNGDRERGRSVYRQVCRGCHGGAHSGNERLRDDIPIVPEASIGYARELGVSPRLVVIEKVRHGGFFGVGGTMPPFSREALSDADLGALLAFLGL